MNSIELETHQNRAARAAKGLTQLLEQIDPPTEGSIWTMADLHTLRSTQGLLVNRIEQLADRIEQAQIKERKALESIQGTHVNGTS